MADQDKHGERWDAWNLNARRNMTFLSHANPQDNTFTMWLALRLAREGYPVWCDLTKLLGGETFWGDIQVAIRSRTAKFLFVLSRSSNVKGGALDELHLALGVERSESLSDFVIPLRIDDLPSRDVQIQLGRKNIVNFTDGWAGGLRAVLKKLDEDGVPRDSRFTPASVTQWWQGSHSGGDLLLQKSDDHLSNWFPITELPPGIYVHTLRSAAQLPRGASEFRYPAHRIGDHLASFAPKGDFDGLVEKSSQVAVDHAIESDDSTLPLTARQFRDCLVRILRQAWERATEQRGLPRYELSRRRIAAYFPEAAQVGARLSFTLPDGFKGARGLYGYKTVWSAAQRRKVRRYWHYGLSADARIFPHRVLVLHGHILFSSDGRTLWDSPKRLHSARRSVGASWWNDDWRDRLLAAMTWLADGREVVDMPVAEGASVTVSRVPVNFESSVSYRDRFGRHADHSDVSLDELDTGPDDDDTSDDNVEGS